MKNQKQEKAPPPTTMAEDEEEEEAEEIPLNGDPDLCNRIMDRYKKSSAPQHRHLCASAAAMRSILQEENLPLTPPAYFAATISAINETLETLDPNAMTSLSSFLSILLPLVPSQSLPPSKASDAMEILVSFLQRPHGTLATSTVRSIVKSLGLLVPFCGVEDWSAVKLPLKTLLAFSVDRRPKVRKCAQVYVEKVFKSFHDFVIIEKVSKVVWSFFKSYMPLATEIGATTIVDGSKSEMMAEPKHLEVLHMLNALKLIVPTLSTKFIVKISSNLYKLLGCQFSPLTRHILNIFEALFGCSRPEVLVSEADNVIILLASYVSSGEKNPTDTLLSASTLLKRALDELYVAEPDIWIKNLPLVFGSVAGLLNFEVSTAGKTADILKDLTRQKDGSTFPTNTNQLSDVSIMSTEVSCAIRSICAVLEDIISACRGIPNEHILAVVSNLFLKLGESSYLYMNGIVLKLSDLMMQLEKGLPGMKHLQECIGSAVIAMGPEKLLSLIPISLNAEKLTCSNIWLIPILKKYVVGASLEYFMECIVPLAESIQRVCCGVKKSPNLKDMQTSARSLWGLLPAFCNYPTDTSKSFESLAKLLIVVLKEDSYMHETIASSLQELVNQNKDIVRAIQDANECPNQSTAVVSNDCNTVPGTVPSHYSNKIASRNIRALASSSMDLLHALADVLFNSPTEKRAYLKEAIGCLASIAGSSNVKNFFTSSLEKFQSINRIAESEKFGSHILKSVNKEQDDEARKKDPKEAQRCLIMELACTLIEGSDEEGINIIFDYIRPSLQADDGVGQFEAYSTLSRIFMVHAWFYSTRFDELIHLLLGQKSSCDIMSLRSRLTCFHFLLIHLLKSDSGNVNAAFLILNEFISTLKDSRKEARRDAYDILLMVSCSLKTSANTDAPLQRLFDMIIGYLSGASPHVMSGAVAALSLLVYRDTSVCFSVPNLLPSVLVLLQSKAKEVVKAVLGFMKVLVSCLHAKDLQKFLSDIVNGVLPWSSVSKNHFRSKVRIILEIVIRKCGSDSVELVRPEKYKSFIKTVVEQRWGKKNSKASGNSDAEPRLAKSSLKGERKRTREDSATPREENGSRDTTDKENKRKKHRSNFTGKSEPDKIAGKSGGGRWNKTQPSCSDGQFQGGQRGIGKNRRGDTIEKPRRGGKEMKMGRRKDSQRGKGPTQVSRGGASTKFHKFKRSGKPHQRGK
ncbi:ARM repeat superfamily protein [Tasmannia lanceolata]|uniref:ARM repeat superfamily protein n=1 Tax=Tasmannia lanceolata TaxID=3420 RepID=UPI004062ED44